MHLGGSFLLLRFVMTKISLRAYIHEINQSIGNKNVDDAIEHCKHILKQFPKHLETYQLLARAYLESGLYGEASDMFLRILSVTPDDFIAQVGLSMIMEEKNDIDSAIWHMERAYEVRNTQTIHEELHRLYLIRDGVAPVKPMITRGTLIRINIRSGLYQQALQEIQRALSDDPSRIDLTILKARIHFMQNNFRKTVNTCEQILKKLPYSYEANSLMAEILGESSESEPYKQKLYELNPYTSFVNESNTIDHVPDNAVMINKFNAEEAYQVDLEPKIADSSDTSTDETFLAEDISQPLESQSEVDSYPETKQEEEVEIPAYLKEQQSEPSMDDPAIPEPQTTTPDKIPNWIKQAGWNIAPERSPEEQQEKISEYDEMDSTLINESEISEDIIETEVPEWLQPIAPDEDTVEDELTEEQADDTSENLEWLDDILTTQTEPDKITEVTKGSEEDKLQDQTSEKQPEFGEELNEDLAWLKTIAPPEAIKEEDKLMKNNPFKESESEWLQPEDKNKQDAEIPEEKKPESEFSPPDIKDDDDFDIDSALSWLEGLAAKQGADEETLVTSPEDRIEEMPDFLIPSTPPELIDEETMPEDLPEHETIGEYKHELEEIPDWLSEVPVDSVEDDDTIIEPIADSEPVVEEDMQFLDKEFNAPPAWLKTIAPPESVRETDSRTDQTPFESSEQPIELTTPPDELLTPSEKIEDGLADHPTGALDFIKINSDEKEEEIDEWLKNLPDMDWQPEESSAEIEDETIPDMELPLDIAPEQTLVEGESSKNATFEVVQENDTEFIEKLFSETPEEETASDEKEENSPYVWENEFSDQETKVPDWISDLTDQSSGSTEEEPHTPSELTESKISFEEVIGESKVMSDDGFEEVNKEKLPDWMLENTESISETFSEDLEPILEPEPIAETTETGSEDPSQTNLEETTSIPLSELIKLNKEDSTYEIEDETVENILGEKLEDVSSDEPPPPETKNLAFLEESDSDTEELEKEEDFSVEETLQKAREDLINSDFGDAYQALENLLKQKSNIEEVIEILKFDIEHYHPIQVDSWVLLGDAYVQQHDLEKALDAYIKAENFIS